LYHMQRQGVTDSVSLQSSLNSSFINEFNAIEQALNSEIDFISPRSSSYLEGSASKSDISNGEENNRSIVSGSANEEYESDSFEVLRPPNARPLPIEDPIETYDLIIDEMKSNGVQWVPENQMNKSLSEVRLAAPDCQQSQNALTPTKSSSLFSTNGIENANNGHQQPINGTTTVQKPSSGANDQSAAENERKLRELQNQLNQVYISLSLSTFVCLVAMWSEDLLACASCGGGVGDDALGCGYTKDFGYEKATRKQQEDYIQQLQHYYDNLLAKHAAAEMTIDHFRFRNQVDPNDASLNNKTPTSNPKTPSHSTGLYGRKLISTSLDTCSPGPLLSKSNHRQSHTTGSLMTLRGNGSPNEESMPKRISSVTPKVHLMSLSSVSQNPLEVEPDQQQCNGSAPFGPVDGVNEGDSSYRNTNPSLNNSRVNHLHQRSGSNVDMANQEAARSLESQLTSSLDALHDKLKAIEVRLFGDHRNGALAAIKSELEDLSRRYQAGLYLWSEGGFDGNTVVGSRLNQLIQLLERVGSGEQKDATISTPTRPSSLRLVDSHRPNSTELNPTTSSVHTTSLGRQESLSSPVPVLHNTAVGVNTFNDEQGSSSAPTSTGSSLESAESFFVRLLARYNKLKITPGHSKDMESLMQRMLQLSDRYSNQSTVIFPPRSLRRMFESDYTLNTGVNEPLDSSSQIFTQPLSSNMVNDASTKPRQIISPDSGVAQTPLGSSGSSGTSCYGVAIPSRATHLVGNFRETSDFSRPKSATAQTVTHDAPTMDAERKQSDSGFWATDSYSAAPAPLYKGASIPSTQSTEHSDEINIDPNAGRASKMLPDEVMSLEADIKRLREGIARLTSSASVSSGPLYRDNVANSVSSSSTCEEQPRRKSSRRQTLGSNRKSNTMGSSAARLSSLTRRRPRLPNSSSSSSDDDGRGTTFSPYATRPRYPHSSRSRNRRSLNPSSPPLEVIGSCIDPQPRNPLPAQTRVYRRNSSTSRGHDELSSVSHRRSHSTTGRSRSYYHPCGSCGGSGYNINVIGREPEGEFAYEPPLHNHSISDTYTMPTRVIYEYSRQGPVIRLPNHDYSGWTERVYGMKEVYGSSVSPQTGRAYNTIGHQPSTNLRQNWLNPNQPAWDVAGRQSGMMPATSSPITHQKSTRKTRQYMPSVGSNSLFYHHSQLEDTLSSGSDDMEAPQRDVAVLPSSKSFRNNSSRNRRRSEYRPMSTEQGGFSSPTNPSIDAFSTARSVTQMAHQLNNKLSRHSECRENAPHQQRSFQQLPSSSVRHSSRSRLQSNGSYLTTTLDDDNDF
uniref:CEP170_C domain-containing protein n=1 Tax=Rodentolepis nana TaxID=102285 RepID=A0A158QGG7_RODNA